MYLSVKCGRFSDSSSCSLPGNDADSTLNIETLTDAGWTRERGCPESIPRASAKQGRSTTVWGQSLAPVARSSDAEGVSHTSCGHRSSTRSPRLLGSPVAPGVPRASGTPRGLPEAACLHRPASAPTSSCTPHRASAIRPSLASRRCWSAERPSRLSSAAAANEAPPSIAQHPPTPTAEDALAGHLSQPSAGHRAPRGGRQGARRGGRGRRARRAEGQGAAARAPPRPRARAEAVGPPRGAGAGLKGG
ncbi:unnamed protein product, partial [Prorocentrum cordatum]